MNQITEVSRDFRQRHQIPIEGSEVLAYLTLEFKPLLYCWTFSLVWGSFSVYNEVLVHSPNVLYQYAGQIPFGMAVYTASGQDPMTQDVFETGEAELYILTSDEVQSVEDAVTSGNY